MKLGLFSRRSHLSLRLFVVLMYFYIFLVGSFSMIFSYIMMNCFFFQALRAYFCCRITECLLLLCGLLAQADFCAHWGKYD